MNSTPSKIVKNKFLSKLDNKEYREAYVNAHVRNRIAFQIKAIRRMKGLTQNQFAKALGLTQNAISRIEDPSYGKLTLSTLKSIASKLDVALIVKFASFSEFIHENIDLSESRLAVLNYEQEKSSLLNSTWKPTYGITFSTVVGWTQHNVISTTLNDPQTPLLTSAPYQNPSMYKASQNVIENYSTTD